MRHFLLFRNLLVKYRASVPFNLQISVIRDCQIRFQEPFLGEEIPLLLQSRR